MRAIQSSHTQTFIKKLAFLLTPEARRYRYITIYGGRAGGKSYSVATAIIALVIKSHQEQSENGISYSWGVLCCRQHLVEVRESIYSALINTIDKMRLRDQFKITEKQIIHIPTGIFFIFRGLAKNVGGLKSLERIKYAIVEEAHEVPRDSWEYLINTVRETSVDSPDEMPQIWVVFNPENYTDETYQRFVVNKSEDNKVVHINFYHNPFCPKAIWQEAKRWKAIYPEDYARVFLGEPRQMSDALIFKNKFEVKDFETPKWDKLWQRNWFYGLDFGYAQDPTALVRCFIMDEDITIDGQVFNVKNLYVDYEAGGKTIELTHYDKLMHKIPSLDYHLVSINTEHFKLDPHKYVPPPVVYADNSRPDAISFLKKSRLPVKECVKTKIEDGIEFLRGFYKIYIHPRCKETIKEFQNYSFKVNKNNNEIMSKIDTDAGYDHYIDAIRYAMSKLISTGGGGLNIRKDYRNMINKL
jgi:phage terminase large subunit